jgi:hypothetical protein
MAETIAEACTREQRPHTAGRAVEAIGQDASGSIRWFLLGRGASELLIGLGQGCCTGLLSVAEMPNHAATDNCRQIDLVGETAAMLFIGEEIHR